ncbi:Uncharacterised protein [Mycobacteroides abscessus subsp. massiliense]|nr:hypothetical protein [Mycobacteroides abscessus]SLH51836.1 Uncharacterised protein [Mycobacteroides abscessus subsp. massiliense]
MGVVVLVVVFLVLVVVFLVLVVLGLRRVRLVGWGT